MGLGACVWVVVGGDCWLHVIDLVFVKGWCGFRSCFGCYSCFVFTCVVVLFCFGVFGFVCLFGFDLFNSCY